MTIGIIGGSGLYDLEGLENVRQEAIDTPFGIPSDVFVHGELGGRDVYFLPRHGRGHKLLPSEINHRANIFGFKLLGVDRVLSVSAVGSLKEELRPRDIVLPDQYFDRTKRSADHTFFGDGVVAHVSFAEPACGHLRNIVEQVATSVTETSDSETRVHSGGTYVNMEGPAFSTKAESHFHRHFGFDVIGMTSLAEAKLCREAELCYQAMAMVTDYDCWHETEEAVTVEMVIGHLVANTKLAKQIVQELVPAIPAHRDCGCGEALGGALLTDREAIAADQLERLRPLIGRYV